MKTFTSLAIFLAVALGIHLFLYLLMLPFVTSALAFQLSLLMVFPVFWAARLILGFKRGRITKRFAFTNSMIPTSLIVSTPRVLDRREARWTFNSYILRETMMCVVVWALMFGNMMLPHILVVFGVEV